MSCLLEMKNITKSFGAVKAIDDVSLRLNAGEINSSDTIHQQTVIIPYPCAITAHKKGARRLLF